VVLVASFADLRCVSSACFFVPHLIENAGAVGGEVHHRARGDGVAEVIVEEGGDPILEPEGDAAGDVDEIGGQAEARGVGRAADDVHRGELVDDLEDAVVVDVDAGGDLHGGGQRTGEDAGARDAVVVGDGFLRRDLHAAGSVDEEGDRHVG